MATQPLSHCLVETQGYIVYKKATNNLRVFVKKRTCHRCGIEKRIKSFKKHPRKTHKRLNVCRWCYDNNQLKDLTWSPERKEAFKSKLLGRKYTLKHRLAISRGQRRAVKEGRHHWKVNDEPHRDAPRMHIEYKLWREKLADVILLCEKCHNKHHDRITEGVYCIECEAKLYG